MGGGVGVAGFNAVPQPLQNDAPGKLLVPQYSQVICISPFLFSVYYMFVTNAKGKSRAIFGNLAEIVNNWKPLPRRKKNGVILYISLLNNNFLLQNVRPLIKTRNRVSSSGAVSFLQNLLKALTCKIFIVILPFAYGTSVRSMPR